MRFAPKFLNPLMLFIMGFAVMSTSSKIRLRIVSFRCLHIRYDNRFAWCYFFRYYLTVFILFSCNSIIIVVAHSRAYSKATVWLNVLIVWDEAPVVSLRGGNVTSIKSGFN